MRQDSAAEEGLHLGHDERRQRGRIAVGLQIGEKGPPVALQGLVQECLFGTMALVSLANSARMNDTGARRRCGAGVGRSSLRHQLRSCHLQVMRTDWRGKVGSPKGGKDRIVPLTSRLRAALTGIRHLRGSLVFSWHDGRRWTNTTMRAGIKRQEKRRIEGHGMACASTHVLQPSRDAGGGAESDPGSRRTPEHGGNQPLHAPGAGRAPYCDRSLGAVASQLQGHQEISLSI